MTRPAAYHPDENMNPTNSDLIMCSSILKVYYVILQNCGRVKLWQIDGFRVLARKTGRFTIAPLVNSGFGCVKYWQMTLILPSFPPQKLIFVALHTDLSFHEMYFHKLSCFEFILFIANP